MNTFWFLGQNWGWKSSWKAASLILDFSFTFRIIWRQWMRTRDRIWTCTLNLCSFEIHQVLWILICYIIYIKSLLYQLTVDLILCESMLMSHISHMLLQSAPRTQVDGRCTIESTQSTKSHRLELLEGTQVQSTACEVKLCDCDHFRTTNFDLATFTLIRHNNARLTSRRNMATGARWWVPMYSVQLWIRPSPRAKVLQTLYYSHDIDTGQRKHDTNLLASCVVCTASWYPAGFDKGNCFR